MYNYLQYQNRIQLLLYQNNYREAIKLVDNIVKSTNKDSLEHNAYLLLKSKIMLEIKDYKQLSELIETLLESFNEQEHQLFLIDLLLIKVQYDRIMVKPDKYKPAIDKIKSLLPKLEDSIEKKEIEKRKFELLKIDINYLFQTGEERKAKIIIKKELEEIRLEKNERKIAQLEYYLAKAYYLIGEIDKVIIHAHNSYLREKELLNHYYAALSQVVIANAQWRKGKINDSLNAKIQALETFERFNLKYDISSSYNDIGYIMINKGELDLAHEYIKKALSLRIILDSKLGISESYNDIATVFYSKGDIAAARKNFLEAFIKRKELKNHLLISETLLHLIIIEIESNNEKEIKQYQIEFEKLNNISKNQLLNQRYKLSNALILKNSNRIIDHVNAQKLLEELSREPVIYNEIAVLVMLNICDLLLVELKTYENTSVLNEVKNWISKLEIIAREQNSSLLKIKVDWLKSNISLIELNFSESIKYMENARINAEEKGFWRLAITLMNECNLLKKQINRLEDLEDTKLSMKDVIDFSHLQNIVKQLITNKIDDISQYAESAVEYIHTGAFKLGEIGPEVVMSEPIPITSNPQELLAKIGLFYMVALGQGEDANTGLFGPLPIPNIQDHVGITYSFFINDPKAIDERLSGKTYGFFVFILPQILLPFFGERDKIASNIEKELNNIKSPEDISLDFLKTMKLKVLGL